MTFSIWIFQSSVDSLDIVNYLTISFLFYSLVIILDEDSDSADDGNVIITTTTTSQKRKKPVEGEEHEFKQKKKLFIGVKGNNNVVMSGNTITYNNTSRGSSKWSKNSWM